MAWQFEYDCQDFRRFSEMLMVDVRHLRRLDAALQVAERAAAASRRGRGAERGGGGARDDDSQCPAASPRTCRRRVTPRLSVRVARRSASANITCSRPTQWILFVFLFNSVQSGFRRTVPGGGARPAAPALPGHVCH